VRHASPRHPRGCLLTVEREYDLQLSHTLWELERMARRGTASEGLRRSLIETHAQHIRYMEDVAQVPRHQRTIVLLQPKPTQALLLLPSEGMTADELQPLAEEFHRRGFIVMATNLAYRTLDKPGRSPVYWQTCADEVENRFDVLAHYSTRVSILGLGMGGLLGLQVATTRRVGEVVALFPTLGSQDGLLDRLRATLHRLMRREEKMPRTWPEQRKAAAHAARANLARATVPFYVLVEDRNDRSEPAQATHAARKLVQRAATKVRVLRPGESASFRDLPPAVFDEILAFLRRA
jgi:esterase/lipase